MSDAPGDGQPPQDPYQQPYGADPTQQGPYQPPYGQPYRQPAYGADPTQGSYQQPYYGQQPYGGHPAPPTTDGRAVAALAVGIGALVLTCGYGVGLLGSPVAWWLGRSSMRRIDAAQGALGGRGLAQAGLILGIIGTVLLVVGLVGLVALVGLFSASSGSTFG